MTYVVTRPCIGTKDRACVEVCPVDCFYDVKKKKFNTKYGAEVDGEDGDDAVGLLVIHPDECINCGACETECPVEAIFEDSAVPEDQKEFIQINEEETLPLGSEELDKIRCTTS
jgi:NAD-dependent dihydropyrimidine dehydrogenase PreA subunit